jgi:hypothetical protein
MRGVFASERRGGFSTLLSLLVAFLIVDSVVSQVQSAVTSVQCSLSTSTDPFEYNGTAGVYVPLTDDDPDSSDNPGNRRLRWKHGIVQHTESMLDDAPGNDTIHDVKSCWCTQFYDREMEYCPVDFDTCLVQGATGPVTCYSSSGAETFVRGFWPVSFFWFFVLLYAVFFSEPGGSFRDYLRRTCCVRCVNGTSEELLRQDVDRLVEKQPERATFLYRQALSRQRRESMRRHQFSYRRGSSGQLHPTSHGLPVAIPVVVEANHDAHTPQLVSIRTLVLKTKVFTTFNSDGAAQQPVEPTQIHRTNVPQSTQAPSWLPSQFRRENVTLDEMDEELEQGVRCAICLDRLVQGDVIGDIPCEHVFHKQCLKEWLRKFNRCPLCQRSGVATPNFQSIPPSANNGAGYTS